MVPMCNALPGAGNHLRLLQGLATSANMLLTFVIGQSFLSMLCTMQVTKPSNLRSRSAPAQPRETPALLSCLLCKLLDQ